MGTSYALPILRLKGSKAVGAAANTSITVTGITTADKILGVIAIFDYTCTSSDQIVQEVYGPDDVTISAANTITIDSSTTGCRLIVFWHASNDLSTD